MSRTEDRWRESPSRRKAMLQLAGLLAASPLAPAAFQSQADPRPLSEHRRLPGLEEMLTSFDFEPVMFANVPLATYDYTAHGDGSEFTLRRNRQAFDWVDIIPGKPVDAASVDLSTEILGTKMKFPIMVAPTALQVPIHPDGENGMYRAATMSAATPMLLSQNTSTPIEKVAASSNGPLWAQFYPQQDRDTGKEYLDRAQAAGSRAIIVTVDQQASYYERTQQDRNLGGGAGAGGGGRGRGAGTGVPTGAARYRVGANRLWYTWPYLDEIRKVIKVPMLVKGIVSPEDAVLAIEHGADGIIVSNHGGRSMDYGPATIEVLPDIVAAVGGRVPIITDSGYRRGTDIFKALALGANAVLLGRTTRWALSAFGVPGVQRLLAMMQRELVEAAAAAGKTRIKDIDRSVVTTKFG